MKRIRGGGKRKARPQTHKKTSPKKTGHAHLTQNKSISKIQAGANDKTVVGSFSHTDKGYGFVISDSFAGGDLFVAPKNVHGAMHGDTVRVRILSKASDGKNAEGEITEIVSRAVTVVAGRYKNRKTHGEVEPIDTRIPNIYIPKKLSLGARGGEMVAVRIKEYPGHGSSLLGEVTKRLGPASSTGAVYDAILCSHEIRTEFPRAVKLSSENITKKILPSELEGRLDLRNRRVFTIDGAYAKDFDDAVSIEKTPRGTYILGVHIADVSHYVRPHSPIDEEAYLRGTSIYFTDKVIPMLPERLSNDICSLRPNEDRLTLSCIMELDKNGSCVDYEIRESVIRSCERLIYSDVSDILNNKNADNLKRQYAHILDDLYNMNELRAILSLRRIRRGSLDFDLPEPYIELDDEGNPISIRPRERGTADNLIEEFMLCANETVARHLKSREIPAVYRVHEAPSYDKTENFISLLGLFGIAPPKDKKLSNSYLRSIQAKIRGEKYEPVVLSAMLRSLMKAEYSHEPKGHFGLSLPDYCHFTSPIRRYPDLLVHRALKNDMYGYSLQRARHMRSMKDAAAQCTGAELCALECERDIENLYKTIYMKKFVGEAFEGMIASVSGAGFFVELPNTVRGLVSMVELNDDYYIYDDKNLRLFGKHRNKTYTVGDIIRVRLIRVDIERRMIDFSPA